MHFSQNLLSFTGLAFSLVQVAVASPVPAPHFVEPVRHRFHQAPTPSLPSTGATSSNLPAPDPSLSLKYITLGRGVQNYTCASSTSADVPASIGALASLFDITSLEQLCSEDLNSLPNAVVYEPIPSGNKPIRTPYGSFPLIGHHYFNATNTPTFNLSSVDNVLWGKKTGDVPPPADANKGPAGTGAVDWLQLQDKGGSYGVVEVYRVDTAGGSPPANCAGQPAMLSVQYAAEYWFYD